MNVTQMVWTLLNGVRVNMRTAPFSCVALSVLLTALAGAAAGSAKPPAEKPYRVLVVIGDQWGDPGSYAIHATQTRPPRTPGSAKDFVDVVTMLKIWGIPFDILRLDEQRLQINRFLNGVAEPNYRCVIWMADPEKLQGYSAHYQTLRRVVQDYGISLIALFDYIRVQDVADLVGVEYGGATDAFAGPEGSTLAINGKHFITEDIAERTITANGGSKARVVRCKARPGTQVLGTLQNQPQIVVRDVSAETKAVWIGGGHDWFDKAPSMRALFRRALVYCIGYGLFNDNFENAFMVILDDMGTSEHAYSLRWHYPTPSKETIIKTLVEPLEKRGLVIVQNVCPGYANPVTRMVENPWTVPKFTDPFGNVQNYGSTKEGLDEGVRRGVFEIHAHRMWTHLNWDLDSAPGPWWDVPIEGERANGAWYNENFDYRRGVSCPANDILFTYKVGRDAIERQFGVTPLATTVVPGADLEHENGRLAVMAGYGVGRRHYLGPDNVIQFSIIQMTPEQQGCHDIDLLESTASEVIGKAVQGKSAAVLRATRVVGGRAPFDMRDPNWPDRWKDKRWIGFNEYSAYLHSHIEAATSPEGLTLDVDYDAHYCRHFAKNASKWTLELSEDHLKKLGSGATVTLDGKKQILAGHTVLTISPGIGRHRVVIH